MSLSINRWKQNVENVFYGKGKWIYIDILVFQIVCTNNVQLFYKFSNKVIDSPSSGVAFDIAVWLL